MRAQPLTRLFNALVSSGGQRLASKPKLNNPTRFLAAVKIFTESAQVNLDVHAKRYPQQAAILCSTHQSIIPQVA